MGRETRYILDQVLFTLIIASGLYGVIVNSQHSAPIAAFATACALFGATVGTLLRAQGVTKLFYVSAVPAVAALALASMGHLMLGACVLASGAVIAQICLTHPLQETTPFLVAALGVLGEFGGLAFLFSPASGKAAIIFMAICAGLWLLFIRRPSDRWIRPAPFEDIHYGYLERGKALLPHLPARQLRGWNDRLRQRHWSSFGTLQGISAAQMRATIIAGAFPSVLAEFIVGQHANQLGVGRLTAAGLYCSLADDARFIGNDEFIRWFAREAALDASAAADVWSAFSLRLRCGYQQLPHLRITGNIVKEEATIEVLPIPKS